MEGVNFNINWNIGAASGRDPIQVTYCERGLDRIISHWNSRLRATDAWLTQGGCAADTDCPLTFPRGSVRRPDTHGPGLPAADLN